MSPERLFNYIVYAGLGLMVSGWLVRLSWDWLIDVIRDTKKGK